MMSRLSILLLALFGLCLPTSGCSSHSEGSATADSPQDGSVNGDETSADADVVVLSPLKQSAAGIQIGEVQRRVIEPMTTVPGRVQYDEARHVAVKAPTAGILREVMVQPGSQVSEGDVLASISSPEVGTARADVLKRQAEYELAQKKYEWRNTACQGLRKLVAAVMDGQNPQTLSQNISSLKLGNYRGLVVSAYSRFRLAESLATAANSASNSGALSGRTIQERLSERDSARAALTAITEQSLFEACQQSDIAKSEMNDAERRLKISRQMVRTLLGYSDSADLPIDEKELSHVEIHAPMTGTIESRTFTNTERLKQGDELFILADTSQLWISADIREKEWSALKIRSGESLAITSPAMPNQVLTSKVEYVGREVDPKSNAVPLIATISNTEGLLRPGQFVWVRLPLASERSALAIPESAVVDHNGQSFVFVPEGENRFRRVDVKTGLRTESLIEILSGLQAGMPVVIEGAFALKSELLLEREE